MNSVLRTPEERFSNLEGYDFEPNYLELKDGLRMHYVDEGDPNMPTALLLHGEPSWSYLYRKMIPPLTQKFRVIAPDLIGFGKSDKPTDRQAYSYQKHLDWLSEFLEVLNLKNILLFCQDWGGLLGLRLLTTMTDRFDMVVASNTTLPTGQTSMPESFLQWRAFSQNSASFNIARIIDTGTVASLSEQVYEAYNAPFPDERYKAGARIFPVLVPIEANEQEALNNRTAWQELMQFHKPFLTVFGSKDTIMFGAEKAFQKLVPGTKDQDHKILEAGHFIQEEKGVELADLMIEFYEKNSKNN